MENIDNSVKSKQKILFIKHIMKNYTKYKCTKGLIKTDLKK